MVVREGLRKVLGMESLEGQVAGGKGVQGFCRGDGVGDDGIAGVLQLEGLRPDWVTLFSSAVICDSSCKAFCCPATSNA